MDRRHLGEMLNDDNAIFNSYVATYGRNPTVDQFIDYFHLLLNLYNTYNRYPTPGNQEKEGRGVTRKKRVNKKKKPIKKRK